MTSAARCLRLRHRSSEACARPHFRRLGGRAAVSEPSRHRLREATRSLPRTSCSRRRRSPADTLAPASRPPRRSRGRHPSLCRNRALLLRSRRGSSRQPPRPRFNPPRRRRPADRPRSRPVPAPTRRTGRPRDMTIRRRKARHRCPHLLPSRRARMPPLPPRRRRHHRLRARPPSPMRPSRTATRTMAAATANRTGMATPTGTVSPKGTTDSRCARIGAQCAPASRNASVPSGSP